MPEEKPSPAGPHARNKAYLLLDQATRTQMVVALVAIIQQNPALALDALAAATDPDRERKGSSDLPADERSDLIRHLHSHPDHAGRYPAGHDFVLVSTADIRRQHERQHAERATGQ